MKRDKEYWDNVKSRSEIHTGSTAIIAGKSQFKGNTVNMWTCTSKKNKEIVVSNSYYMGHVIQTYLINDDTTRIEYTNTIPSPKWLRRLLSTNPVFNNMCDIRIQMKDMYCHFSSWQYMLSCTVEHKGLMFKGNIDNINTLKELKSILGGVRSIIKKYTQEELTKLGSTGVVEGVQYMGDSNTIVIKHNDLVKFDRRMSDHSE
tara:strand:- start:1791 stop:2399 length:609 start_codon:yes stop_codon:yes gene_type:complete